MNIQNRLLDNYTAFSSQADRSGNLRVSAPPRRLDADSVTQTASGSAASENPVDLSEFANFQAMLKRELNAAPGQTDTELSRLSRTLDQIASEVRSGSYSVDATATASRLNNLELLLR